MRRKPENLKRLQGTLRADRRGRVAAESATVSGAPRMPPGLSPAVQKVWRRIAPAVVDHGVLPIDQAALVDLCTCLVRLGQAESEIDRHGVLVEGYRGSIVKNPAVSVAQGYRQAVMKWAKEFGLTPLARGGLVVPDEDPADLSLSEILFNLVPGDKTTTG